MTLAEVRNLAMDLHGSTESPHHRYTSFRLRGRIYATAPKEGGFLHVFVDEPDRDRMRAPRPASLRAARLGQEDRRPARGPRARAARGRESAAAHRLAAQAAEAPMSTDIRPITAKDISALLPLVEQYWLFEDVAGFDTVRVGRELERAVADPRLGERLDRIRARRGRRLPAGRLRLQPRAPRTHGRDR